MNDWLTNERATEHSLDNRRFYEFVFASLNYNEKIEQALYDEKISSYRTTNRFLTDAWTEKYNYSLYEELYAFGKFINEQ